MEERMFEIAEARAEINWLLAKTTTLTERERFVLNEILNNKTLREIGGEMGIVHQRVAQIRDKAIKKIRRRMVIKI